MTPIITLAMAIRRKLSKEETDAIHSASIIEERSIALVHFIERYKKLTTLPPIKPERFLAEDLFARTEQLFKEELETKGIRFIRQASCNIELEADRQMLEQVLINLVKNAAEALQETKNPEIELFCQLESDQGLYISIRDNGEGIPAEKQEQVFVPFFTTREKGSGIGLNLCRQIIRLHKGQIHIESIPGEGTSVILRFPA
jgi:two-component system nitrogen regulation sensor histidine kinase NtrY